MSSGGGGGTTGQSSSYGSLASWAEPYITSVLGAAQNQVFNTTPTAAVPAGNYDQNGNPVQGGGYDANGNPAPGTAAGSAITGIRGYNAYGTDNGQGGQYGMTQNDLNAANASVAGFTGLQNQAFTGAGNLGLPSAYGQAGNLYGNAAQGALNTTGQAGSYGSMGSVYGQMGASNAQQAANQAAGLSNAYGQMGAGYGQQGANIGASLAQQSTNPNTLAAYMNPFIQNSLNPSLQLLNQQYGMQGAAEQGAATSAGAFGGSREALMSGLNQQNQDLARQQLIGNQYYQAAEGATQQMNAANQAALAGNAQALQGAGIGLQGVGQNISAGQLGLAGANTGISGAQAGLQGVNAQLAGYGLAGTQGQNLANLGTAQLAGQQNILNQQSQFGGMQQQQNQNVINQAMQNYAMGQQYPMTQLQQLQGLMAGLPVANQTTTQQTAAPNVASQLAGFGTAGVAGLALANQATPKAKGGTIKAKRFAAGGIAEKISRDVMMAPDNYSAQEIDKAGQDGTIPAPVAGIAKAIQLSDKAKSGPPVQAPQSTVVDDLQAQVAQKDQAENQDKLAELENVITVKLKEAIAKNEPREIKQYAEDLHQLKSLLASQQMTQQNAPAQAMPVAPAPAPQGIQAAAPQPAPAQMASGGITKYYGDPKKNSDEDQVVSSDLGASSATEGSTSGVADFLSALGRAPGYVAKTLVGAPGYGLSNVILPNANSASVAGTGIGANGAYPTEVSSSTPVAAKPGGDIIIHPTDNYGIRGAAPAPALDPSIKALLDNINKSTSAAPAVDSGAGIDAKLKQYFDMIHGSANDDDKKREQAGLLRVIQGGLDVAGGTSPFFGVNASKASQAVQGYAQDLAALDASKEKRIQQLVALGLTGEQLKMEASKLGISQQELEQGKQKLGLTAALIPSEVALRSAQTGLAGAQAGYYGRKSGTTGSMGLGSIPPATYDKVTQRYEGYRADPKSAPFFAQLPADVQKGLTDYKPNTGSYQRAKTQFDDILDKHQQSYMTRMKIESAKTNPLASLLEPD